LKLLNTADEPKSRNKQDKSGVTVPASRPGSKACVNLWNLRFLSDLCCRPTALRRSHDLVVEVVEMVATRFDPVPFPWLILVDYADRPGGKPKLSPLDFLLPRF